MYYIVPNMKLIPQDKTMSCWYASGWMLIDWDRRTNLRTSSSHPDPSQVKKWGHLYDKNTGISNDKIKDFAEDLGLDFVPPMSPTPEAIQKWLIDHGPLWVNGKQHITVIAGIRDTNGNLEVLVYDPAMPHKKHGEWRDFTKWYIMDAFSGRDTANEVETVFLRLPD
jgi:Papain-like cysteine protease AvrRpt2